jgi:hypothetical protein
MEQNEKEVLIGMLDLLNVEIVINTALGTTIIDKEQLKDMLAKSDIDSGFLISRVKKAVGL